jgi:cyclohexanecarboxylate-CoA ligase
VPDEKRAATDGVPVAPNRTSCATSAGKPSQQAVGNMGARTRACLGYRDDLNAEAFMSAGSFRPAISASSIDGYLTITGRVKDIIIRGGEKFSAKEVEDLLFEHPKVRSVAIVPMPDARLGQRACAFVVPADANDPPALPELVRFLETHELSRRKLPERLEVVSELPVTASGKVQKHVLRERIARQLGSKPA